MKRPNVCWRKSTLRLKKINDMKNHYTEEARCLMEDGNSTPQHNLPPKMDGSFSNEGCMENKSDDCKNGKDCIEDDDFVFNSLTLKEIQNICRARQQSGSLSNPSKTSGLNRQNNRKRRRHAHREPSEDESDLEETLGSWRSKLSTRRVKKKKRGLVASQIISSSSASEVSVRIEQENVTILSCGNSELASLDRTADVAACSSAECDQGFMSPISTVFESHNVEDMAGALEVKNEDPDSSLCLSAITDCQNQNDFDYEPSKDRIQNNGSCSDPERTSSDVPSNQVFSGSSGTISADVCSPESSQCSSLMQKRTSSPIVNDVIQTHAADADDALECFGEFASADNTLNSVDISSGISSTESVSNLSEDEPPARVNDDIVKDKIEGNESPSKLLPDKIEAEDRLNIGSEVLTPELIQTQSASGTSSLETSSPSLPDCTKGCHLEVVEGRSREVGDGSSAFLDASSSCYPHVDESLATKVLSDMRAKQAPKKLFVKRKAISPTSQEKLCQVMDDEEIYKRLKFANRTQFDKWIKSGTASPEVGSEVVDAAELVSRNVTSIPPTGCIAFSSNRDGHPMVAQKSPPPLAKKGILKASCGPCIVSRSCPKCASIRSHVQKSIDFSQRQMRDINSLATNLVRELKSLTNVIEENLLSETYSSTPRYNVNEVKAATTSAAVVEETTRRWLFMMSRDCSRFCKIMKVKEKMPPVKGGGLQKAQKKITFADEAGGLLCHVKVFGDHCD